MEKLRQYVNLFNENDNELYKNEIDNAHALEWLEREIPLFECPDEDIERTYYFRWWTYRKHIKNTVDGYVITEFLPNVSWSGKHNVINAPVGHHLAEGRWLRNSKTYITDYVKFLLDNNKITHTYSSWMITAILDFYRVTGEMPADKNFVKTLCDYYEEWEKTHQLPNGMFWSLGGWDAMEYSISGNWDGEEKKGIRPTLNSYMCADAEALAIFAEYADMPEVAEKFRLKYENLKKLILENLWDRDFFKAYHYENDDWDTAFEKDGDNIPRELMGYIPWCFDIPSKAEEYNQVFSRLESKEDFYTEFGIATAEQRNPRFLYEADHECLWNGYVWPFATSQTLTALNRFCIKNPTEENRAMFIRLLKQYARSHKRITEEGKTVPWIDEVRHPYRDEWSSREILKSWGWQEGFGGEERGKDYNHSTFCDLVICGIAGVNPRAKGFDIKPNIPDDWDYMKLDNLYYRGDCYSIIYDKTGTKYNMGKGFVVYKNEQEFMRI